MLLELTAKINKTTNVYIRLIDTTGRAAMPKPEEINAIIKKKFNFDFDLDVNAKRILSELQPYCLEVSISPILKGSSYSYTVTAKK